jgi:hypothetical protein
MRNALISGTSVSAFTFVVTAVILAILGHLMMLAHNGTIMMLFAQDAQYAARIIVLNERVDFLEVNITQMFNDTASINASIIAYNAFLDNYTCDQLLTINDMPNPCNGTFYIYGVGNITILPGSLPNQINISAYELKSQLDNDQAILDFISMTLAIINGELTLLNMDAVKKINNITRDSVGNINMIGLCGVNVTEGFSNTTSDIIIDTCGLQNNASSLVNELNISYILIQDKIVSTNQTIQNLTAEILVDQANIDSINVVIVKNINGQLPVLNDIDFVGGPGMSVTNIVNGSITFTNIGVVTLNGLNNNRNVNIVAGPGTGITANVSGITVVNTQAQIAFTPCVVRSVAVITVGSPIFFFAQPFGPLTAFSFYTTNPACPTPFTVDSSGYNHYIYTQPLGVWAVYIRVGYALGSVANGAFGLDSSCPPSPGLCSYTMLVGLMNNVTGVIYATANIYPTTTNTNPFTIGSIFGQVTISSDVVPVGTSFFVFHSVPQTGGLPGLQWTATVMEVGAIRIA